jgi:hypothetical protein
MNYDEIMRRADEELERQFKEGIISRRVYEGTKSTTEYQQGAGAASVRNSGRNDGVTRQGTERGNVSRRGPPEAGEGSREESSAVTPATPEPASASSTTSIPKVKTKSKPADRPSGETVTAPVQADASNSQEDKFSSNKIFTSSAIEAAKARLAAKRNSLRTGFDPELLQDLLIVDGGHFEAVKFRFRKQKPESF